MDYKVIYVLIFFQSFVRCNVHQNNFHNPAVEVYKCCGIQEIYVGMYCSKVNATNQWYPLFTSDKGETNLQINYTLKIGKPNCGHSQPWPIYHYQTSSDKLRLLPNGVLRHYFDNKKNQFDWDTELIEEKNKIYYDFGPGQYCLDKKIDDRVSEFALVCVPDIKETWTTNEFLMHNIVNPITHGITIICLLIVAIVYFVMPTLRDLVGNIVTTICMCLIVSQTADLVRLLTVFKSHISLIITDTICYLSLLGAFFWLNSLGYYIWKTFRSRNVFLRITDGKKYCYYGAYAWSCTIVLGILAVFAHFTMDYQDIESSNNPDQQQEQIGSLGMIIFFVPVAFTVIVDIFFFATTLKKLNKMHTYGRIHHKLRHSFRMFLLLLLVMTLCWLFFLSSFSQFEGLINSYIIVNAFQGPIILYICILNQKHVAFSLKKTCCYENCICPCCRPEQENEWGDEMMAMNTEYYSRGEQPSYKFSH